MDAEVADLQLKLQQTEAAIAALEEEERVAARLEQALKNKNGELVEAQRGLMKLKKDSAVDELKQTGPFKRLEAANQELTNEVKAARERTAELTGKLNELSRKGTAKAIETTRCKLEKTTVNLKEVQAEAGMMSRLLDGMQRLLKEDGLDDTSLDSKAQAAREEVAKLEAELAAVDAQTEQHLAAQRETEGRIEQTRRQVEELKQASEPAGGKFKRNAQLDPEQNPRVKAVRDRMLMHVLGKAPEQEEM